MEHWGAVVDLLHPETEASMPIDVTCISLGQALFVNIPGEPMAITAGRLRELSTRFDAVFTLGYTNGLTGLYTR